MEEETGKNKEYPSLPKKPSGDKKPTLKIQKIMAIKTSKGPDRNKFKGANKPGSPRKKPSYKN